MKFAILFATVCLAAAQTYTPPTSIAPVVASVALPTYVSVGAAFNQIGTPRFNIFASAIYPVASSAGLYTSTSTDVYPVLTTDPATKRQYYGFSTSIRQGLHRVMYKGGSFVFLLGGDGGLGLSQASPSGTNITLAGSFQATLIYRLGAKWALVAAPGGVYVNSSWNLIPRLGISFKP